MFAQHSKPFVIPELKEWKGSNGKFVLKNQSRIVCSQNDKELNRIARQFSEECQAMFGITLVVVDEKLLPSDIMLKIKEDAKMPQEGYSIDIKDEIIISAPESIGVFWATRSILQMLEQSESLSLTCGHIKDYPDYSVRGFMLDCGRKFIPLSFLQDYVKIMSYYKMNTFQIHLNDNAFPRFYGWDLSKTYSAFRLESRTYPGLAAEDGFYTKQEFIELQKLAENNFVDIIPEIDVPAHSLAFAQYKPELGSKKYGMDHLDLFNPETYTFLDGLFKEYLDGDQPVFRGKVVQIGTDEYSNKDPEVVEKFRYFTNRYINLVESYGKQAAIWGALTHAEGITKVKSENVIMNAWYNKYADPNKMIEQGYQLISIPDGAMYIVPSAGYYNDYLKIENLYENWTPVHIGNQVFEEKHSAILGGMFAVWNDHAGNGISTKDIHNRTFPALQTLATKMWTGKKTSFSFRDFNVYRKSLSEAPSVNQGGRIGRKSGLVYEQKIVLPNTHVVHQSVGKQYKVQFELKGQPEKEGTELFRSDDAVFYLSDPITGMMGFARDGYLNTFSYRVKKENKPVCIEGDSVSTRLYIDGHLIDDLQIAKKYFNSGKDSMNYVRTLVFPLSHSGNFESEISNLKIYQKQ